MVCSKGRLAQERASPLCSDVKGWNPIFTIKNTTTLTTILRKQANDKRGNKWIYAQCDMLSSLFPMLQFRHFCHPGFSGDHSPFVQTRRRLTQQSQIHFPSPSSLFLLSCRWRVPPHLCWDDVLYILVFPRLPC